MADISKIKVLNGSTYDVKDALAVSNITASGRDITFTKRNGTTETISSILAEKEFTGVIATGTSQDLSNFYFGSIRPTSFNGIWCIHYLLETSIPNTDYSGIYDCQLSGAGNSLNSFCCLNNMTSIAYRPMYYHTIFKLQSAGYTAGLGHALGIGLRNSWNPTNSTYKRNIKVQVLELINCEFTFFDSPKIKTALPSYSTTNYAGVSEPDCAWQGLNETRGDNSYYLLKYDQPIKAGSAITATNIIVGNNGTYQNLKTGNAFDISYQIMFGGSSIASGATGTNNFIVHRFAIAPTQSMTLTAYEPIYIKGKLSGTLFTPVSTAPLTQTVPTTEDGYQYIYLGQAYSATNMYLMPEHPIYEFINGKFQLYGKERIIDVTLSASDWSASAPYTQTVSVTGISQTDRPEVFLSYPSTINKDNSEEYVEAFSCINKAETEDGSLTVTAFNEKPAVDLYVTLKCN